MSTVCLVDIGHLDVGLSCSSVLRSPHQAPPLAQPLGSLPQSPGPVLLLHLLPCYLAGGEREWSQVKMYGLCTVLLSVCQAPGPASTIRRSLSRSESRSNIQSAASITGDFVLCSPDNSPAGHGVTRMISRNFTSDIKPAYNTQHRLYSLLTTTGLQTYSYLRVVR